MNVKLNQSNHVNSLYLRNLNKRGLKVKPPNRMTKLTKTINENQFVAFKAQNTQNFTKNPNQN